MEEAASDERGCGGYQLEKKRIGGKREWSIFLYYFIELSVKIKNLI